ncbi:MAG TPA: hypothetical protein VHZ07_20070 [Bryobacteraceae bacterium]|jgi:hypothetical protein|nr:hypothetical protein [Bryobacteraceae bacterium]
MRDHVKILGILSMVLGGLGLVVALGVFALFGGIAGAAGVANSGNDGLAGAGIVAVIGLFLAGVIAVISLPQLLGGWGLINYKPWARVLMIVVSVVSLLHVPLGTALGVYGLWVLFNEETKYLFAHGGRPPAPYSPPAYASAPGAYQPPPSGYAGPPYAPPTYPAPARPSEPAPTPGYPTQPPQ